MTEKTDSQINPEMEEKVTPEMEQDIVYNGLDIAYNVNKGEGKIRHLKDLDVKDAPKTLVDILESPKLDIFSMEEKAKHISACLNASKANQAITYMSLAREFNDTKSYFESHTSSLHGHYTNSSFKNSHFKQIMASDDVNINTKCILFASGLAFNFVNEADAKETFNKFMSNDQVSIGEKCHLAFKSLALNTHFLSKEQYKSLMEQGKSYVQDHQDYSPTSHAYYGLLEISSISPDTKDWVQKDYYVSTNEYIAQELQPFYSSLFHDSIEASH